MLVFLLFVFVVNALFTPSAKEVFKQTTQDVFWHTYTHFAKLFYIYLFQICS